MIDVRWVASGTRYRRCGAGVKSRGGPAALRLIESGRMDVRPLVTHRFALQDFEKAFDLLSTRKEPVVKVTLRP